MSTVGDVLDRLAADIEYGGGVEPWIMKRIRGRTYRRFETVRSLQVGLDTPNSPACRGKYHKTRMRGCCLPLFVEGSADSRRWRR